MVGTTPPPWNVNEKWEYWEANGKRYARVTGRTAAPDVLKKNWAWWFRNDWDQKVTDPDAAWFHPEWPQWRRELVWNVQRNPMMNFRLFVAGVADRNYTVEVIEGNPDPMTIQRNDWKGPDGKAEMGYQKTKLTLDDGTVKTFTSFCSEKVIWYLGTMPTGIYGAKLVKGTPP